jgi:hypothetical protein
MASPLSIEEVRALLGDEVATLSDIEIRQIHQHASQHAEMICEVIRRRGLRANRDDASQPLMAVRRNRRSRRTPR